MKKLVFDPDDFAMSKLQNSSRSAIAARAQGLHDQFVADLMKEAKVVYGSLPKGNVPGWYGIESVDCTHKALLINIEPLKPCEHEPHMTSISGFFNDDPRPAQYDWKCSKCGVEIQPTGWKTK